MNYAQCRAYLDRLGNEVLTMKFGLETIRRLLDRLGNPHHCYPAVLVTGTNGKGSVVRFLHSVATHCGIHAARYTSPHLVRVEERLAVGGQICTPEQFADCFSETAAAIRELSFPYHPTYFETVTAAAFLFFARHRAELAVLEIGMGGRLDSTNVVDPLASVITPVGMDHQKYLGNTLEAIAFEKAGIIHAGRPVFSAPQKDRAREVLLREARAKQTPFYELQREEITLIGCQTGRFSFSFRDVPYRLEVFGRHQVENAALALACAEQLEKAGFPMSRAGRRRGIRAARVPGVLQRIGEDPLVFLDGAHNAEAAENLARFVAEFTPAPRALVLAMMEDKDHAAVAAPLRPLFDQVYLTRIRSARAAAPERLQPLFPQAACLPDPLQALDQARRQEARTVVVTGSFYLVGEILSGDRP